MSTLVTVIDKKSGQIVSQSSDIYVHLEQSSIVKINADLSTIASTSQEGMDLVLELTNGEQITIRNFFNKIDDVDNTLVFEDETGQLWLAAYNVPFDGLSLSELASLDALTAASTASTDGGLVALGILGAAAAGAAIASGSSSSGGSNNAGDNGNGDNGTGGDNGNGGDGEDGKEPGDGEDGKEPGDGEDGKEPGDGEDGKEPGDGEDGKEPGDGEDGKEPGDGSETDPGKIESGLIGTVQVVVGDLTGDETALMHVGNLVDALIKPGSGESALGGLTGILDDLTKSTGGLEILNDLVKGLVSSKDAGALAPLIGGLNLILEGVVAAESITSELLKSLVGDNSFLGGLLGEGGLGLVNPEISGTEAGLILTIQGVAGTLLEGTALEDVSLLLNALLNPEDGTLAPLTSLLNKLTNFEDPNSLLGGLGGLVEGLLNTKNQALAPVVGVLNLIIGGLAGAEGQEGSLVEGVGDLVGGLLGGLLGADKDGLLSGGILGGLLKPGSDAEPTEGGLVLTLLGTADGLTDETVLEPVSALLNALLNPSDGALNGVAALLEELTSEGELLGVLNDLVKGLGLGPDGTPSPLVTALNAVIGSLTDPKGALGSISELLGENGLLGQLLGDKALGLLDPDYDASQGGLILTVLGLTNSLTSETGLDEVQVLLNALLSPTDGTLSALTKVLDQLTAENGALGVLNELVAGLVGTGNGALAPLVGALNLVIAGITGADGVLETLLGKDGLIGGLLHGIAGKEGGLLGGLLGLDGPGGDKDAGGLLASLGLLNGLVGQSGPLSLVGEILDLVLGGGKSDQSLVESILSESGPVGSLLGSLLGSLSGLGFGGSGITDLLSGILGSLAKAPGEEGSLTTGLLDGLVDSLLGNVTGLLSGLLGGVVGGVGGIVGDLVGGLLGGLLGGGGKSAGSSGAQKQALSLSLDQDGINLVGKDSALNKVTEPLVGTKDAAPSLLGGATAGLLGGSLLGGEEGGLLGGILGDDGLVGGLLGGDGGLLGGILGEDGLVGGLLSGVLGGLLGGEDGLLGGEGGLLGGLLGGEGGLLGGLLGEDGLVGGLLSALLGEDGLVGGLLGGLLGGEGGLLGGLAGGESGPLDIVLGENGLVGGLLNTVLSEDGLVGGLVGGLAGGQGGPLDIVLGENGLVGGLLNTVLSEDGLVGGLVGGLAGGQGGPLDIVLGEDGLVGGLLNTVLGENGLVGGLLGGLTGGKAVATAMAPQSAESADFAESVSLDIFALAPADTLLDQSIELVNLY